MFWFKKNKSEEVEKVTLVMDRHGFKSFAMACFSRRNKASEGDNIFTMRGRSNGKLYEVRLSIKNNAPTVVDGK